MGILRKRLDLLIDAGLCAVAVVSRLPFVSPLLYDHDSFLFARAVAHYDLAGGIPHPPGYLFYVYLAKLLEHFTRDANHALIWVGILAGALAAVCIHRLGRRLFGRGVGVIAALLYLLGPMIWFYHEIALTYALEGALSVLVALVAWRAYCGSRRAEFLLPVLLGLVGGVRPWLIPQLLPLQLFVTWRRGVPRLLFGLLLLAVASMAWLIPNALSAGGMGAYIAINRNYGGGLFAEGHFGQLARTVRAAGMMALWHYHALGWALLGLLWLALRRWIVRGAALTLPEGSPTTFLLWWIMPTFLLRLFVHLTMPGYLLIFLPGVCLLAALGIYLLAADCSGLLQRVLPADSGLRAFSRREVVLGIFLIAVLAHYLTTFIMGEAGFTWPIIQAKNRIVRERLDFVHHFPPHDTVVFASDMANAAHYYLADYRVINVFWTPGEQAFGPDDSHLPGERARFVVLFDSQLLPADRTPQYLHEAKLPMGLPIFYFQLAPGQQILRSKGAYRLVPAKR